MFIGILYLLAACLCWSVVFVIPDFLTGFSPLEISLGRFFFFGITSIFLILTKKRELFHKSYAAIWKKAFWFGCISTIGCYTFTVFCIRYANPATAALLFGTVPIIVVLCGNLRRKEYPVRIFIIPCLVMSLGILISNREAFLWSGESLSSYLIGVLSGIAGIACWIWYVIACFDFMEKNTKISSMDWVMMLGSSVFCQVLIASLGLFWILEDAGKYFSFTLKLQYFLAGTFVLGVVSSWIALYCWTQGNLRLPIALVGQLAIFELVFGLILIYIVKTRFPSTMEIAGIVLMIAGVLQGFYSLKKFSASKSLDKSSLGE
ncbi:MAG: DMT family transporter [Chlamydiota bacterium]